jgi:hypothetical protein
VQARAVGENIHCDFPYKLYTFLQWITLVVQMQPTLLCALRSR